MSNVIDSILDRMCSVGDCPRMGRNECRNCQAKVCNQHFDITCDEPDDEPGDEGLCPACAELWHASFEAEQKAKRARALLSDIEGKEGSHV